MRHLLLTAALALYPMLAVAEKYIRSMARRYRTQRTDLHGRGGGRTLVSQTVQNDEVVAEMAAT
jgi:hypothetical protein